MCGLLSRVSTVVDASEASRLCFLRRRFNSADVSPGSLEPGTTISIASSDKGEEEVVKETGEDTMLINVDDVVAGVDLSS